jgi:hypothetical protein
MLPCLCSGVEDTAFLTVFVANAQESAQFIATELSREREGEGQGA